MKLITVSKDFPRGFYSALGRFAVAFGCVEYEIKLAVKSLSGKGFSQGMAEAEISGQFNLLCKKAKTLASRKLPEPHLSKFSDLIDQALSLATERNDNLHALWTADTMRKPHRYRPFWDRKKKMLHWRSRSVTARELTAHAQTLLALYESIHACRQAWPPIS